METSTVIKIIDKDGKAIFEDYIHQIVELGKATDCVWFRGNPYYVESVTDEIKVVLGESEFIRTYILS